MRDAIFSRLRIVAWLAAFLAPVMAMEIGRELRSRWEHQNADFAAPTPEYRAAMEAGVLASADR